jgi:hypothetical protein
MLKRFIVLLFLIMASFRNRIFRVIIGYILHIN